MGRRSRGKSLKSKRLALQKARIRARRREIDLSYMGLAKRDRRRIADIGFRHWTDEVAEAQQARKAKAKRKDAEHKRAA